jgi:hypothetical protein
MRIIRKVPPQKPNKVMKIATYWILFLGQTIGDVTILCHLIPLYKRLVTSGLDQKPPTEIFVYAAFGVASIQICYWLNQRWFATLRLGQNPLLGHLILFLSRLNFIFAGSLFSAVCLVRFRFPRSLSRRGSVSLCCRSPFPGSFRFGLRLSLAGSPMHQAESSSSFS